ncbi:uncharacterized protein A4U43_C07F33360 [Asparagus officinalis]|uniref:HRDC domain-containing protein n=1 Tax=Asparagus officinalis TaxID=4686 RepID=A0A5P1EIQ1_ASPOF|nr:uncharacterized protein A4U43_C07F33360 [Asparagus officinalis]
MESNFQSVKGKKKKGTFHDIENSEGLRGKKSEDRRSKVPSHVPWIPRPQEEYNIRVNNSNMRFEHVWLEKSEDGSQFVHPMGWSGWWSGDDGRVGGVVMVVCELVHTYVCLGVCVHVCGDGAGSFQGLTCLKQISTRTEDFAIDTLKLRVHVGPYLREVFKDPSKRKVMQGADCDILWLQRDFGIYVCNLFDTGQASRVLQLERNSLGYLLYHFCGIDVNKEYQNADWRVRLLPDVMLRLREANFNSQQLSIVSDLNEWRDSVARREDETTGYVLPNKALLEIARKMPLSSSKLWHLVKLKSPYVDHNHQTIIRIIRDSIQNASAFEKHAEALKNYLQEKYEQQIEAVGYSSVPLFHVQECEGSKVLPLPEIGCFFKPPDSPEKNNEKRGNGSIRVSKSEKP